jgi:hypothetical protein
MAAKLIASVALLLAFLSGCVSVPAPNQVVQSCSREQAFIRGDVRGSSRGYSENVQARCVADEMHQTTVDTVLKADAGKGGTATVSYVSRDGAESTKVYAQRNVDRYGRFTRAEIYKVRENKYFIWGARVRIVAP